MADRAAQLDPLVVPGAKYFAAHHDGRPDRDAALRQPDEGLGFGQLQQGAIIGHSHARSVGGRVGCFARWLHSAADGGMPDGRQDPEEATEEEAAEKA